MEDIKENILARVCELYLKYGIKSITMDDVARELGVSKKTIYQYFKDKRELVGNAIVYHFSTKNCQLDYIFKKDQNAIDELFEVNEHITKMMSEFNPSIMFDLKKYYPDLYVKLVETRRSKMYESVLNNLNKGKEEGIYRSELNTEIIAKLHVIRIENILDSNVFSVKELMSPEFVTEVFLYHLRGITNDKGINLINEKLKTLNK